MVENVTGGDLYALWRVAEVHLPRVADVFYDANRLMGGAGGGSSAFRADSSAYPGSSVMVSSIGGAWNELRSEMQAMTAQIGDAVLDAAQGVRSAAEAYDTTDRGAKGAILRAYLSDPKNHDFNDAASNPPLPGSVEDPGLPDRTP